MTTHDKDLLLKRINSRLDNVANTLGVKSKLYQTYKSLIKSFLPGKKSLSFFNDSNNRLNFRRTKDVLSNVSDRVLSQIESRMKRDSLKLEKFKIREYLREQGFKGRIGIADYQRAAEEMHDLSESYDKNVKLFYDYSQSAEGAEGIAIAQRKGRRTWAELKRANELANAIRQKAASGEYQPTPMAPYWVRKE